MTSFGYIISTKIEEISMFEEKYSEFINSRKSEETHKCSECPTAEFSTAQGLRTHKRQFHELGQVSSNLGIKKFNAGIKNIPSDFSDKFLTGNWTCTICEGRADSEMDHLKSFNSSQSRIFECGNCNRKFRDERALRQHSIGCV